MDSSWTILNLRYCYDLRTELLPNDDVLGGQNTADCKAPTKGEDQLKVRENPGQLGQRVLPTKTGQAFDFVTHDT